MSASLIRPLLAPILIAATVCVGAQVMLVTPMHKRLIEARRTLQSAQEAAKSVRSEQPHQITLDLESAQRQADRLLAMNELSGDAPALYDTIMAVASRLGVELERMEPAKTGGRRRAGEAGAAVTTYRISVQGAYDAVSDFIGALQSDLGFSDVRSFQMSRSGDAQTVRATITTTHWKFRKPPDASSLTAGVATAGEEEIHSVGGAP